MLLPLRYAWAWLFAGLILLVLGLVSALSAAAFPSAMTLNDKLIHLVGFTGFMVWFCGIVQTRYAPLLALGLAAYGLLIEFLQSLTVTRQPEGLDLVADIAGILVGWFLSAAGLSRWCIKLESWFASAKP
ncbi:MAG: VanZ family protein [Gammaproteobacteria bacterium]|nr:VanZ family protein [Gammaproteobacteria bacterium]